jgi:hypothetical protein
MLTVIVTEDEFKANNGPDIIVLIKWMLGPHLENP